MFYGKRSGIVMLVLLATSAANSALGSTLEKLVMPGKVIEGHANIEAECTLCHVRGRDLSQVDLCLDCHKEVAEDVKQRQGYHGLNPAAVGVDCVACHTDHEGRDAEIVSMNTATFDHSFTDFVLRGAHLLTTCSQCHQQAVPWRDADTTCIACHSNDDIHQGALGPQCNDCHTETDWLTSKFNHGKTNFPLVGKHDGLACDSCHTAEDFSGAPTQCVACHSQDDVHAGIAGKQCGACHSSDNWDQARFDHHQVSNFALLGGHANLGCQDCHSQPSLDDLNGASCNSCHVDDDIHKGKKGTQCLDCHTVNRWNELTFDHRLVADFALLGAHKQVECNACHTQNLTAPLERTCIGCHGGANDPHLGQLGDRCESCHANTSWTTPVYFDHDLVAFPLLGQHAELQCDQCHESAAFHDAGTTCSSCHREDDIHDGALGVTCDQCHNPIDWANVAFDHNRQTTFMLDGAHVQTSCAACHRTAQEAPQVCGQCHRQDDTHSGRFGNDCGRCHSTRSFEDIRDL